MADILLYNAFAKASKDLKVAMGEYPSLKEALLDYNISPNLWTSIPKLTTTNNICVYDNTNFRGNVCCQFTVPAGTTRVRFEAWGAGSGSGAPNCCGHYPFAPTGAYASVILCDPPVGTQYTLCAGNASSCLLTCCAGADVSGSPSYVTGWGLCNFCAAGGCGEWCSVNCSLQYGQRCSPSIGCHICMYGSFGFACCSGQSGFSNNGMCICGGWSMCQSGGYPSNGLIRAGFVCWRTGYGTSCAGTSGFTGNNVYVIPSRVGSDCFDNNNYGCISAPLTLLPNGTVSCPGFFTYDSSSLSGCRCAACSNFYQIPGFGGFFTHAMGGATGLFGDWGRAGMVKVSWC